MKNYSFSNITNEDSYATRKSSDYSSLYRHSDLKASEANLKIQEIKKKYDTPSRRERIESLKKSRQVELRPREENSYHQSRHAPAFGSNALKESFAVNRLQKSSLRVDSQNKELLNFRGNRMDKENEVCFRSNPRQEEEAIFSKVREMKESIINSEYMKGSLQTRNIAPAGRQSEFRSQYEPRVENIDKINSKIKHILSCLNENQRNSRPSRDLGAQDQHNSYKEVSPEFADPRKSYTNLYQNCSKVVEKISIDKEDNLKHSVLQQRKSIQPDDRSKYDQPKASLQQRLKARDYSVNRTDFTKDYSIQRNFKKEQVLRTPTYLRKQLGESAGMKQSGSKSHLDSLKRSNAQESLLKSGKKYNDEITRIQKKIQQFEKEKKKLNIQFTPFSLKNRSTSNLHSNTRPQRQSVDPRENLKDSNQASRPSLEPRSASQDYKFKSSLGRGSIYQQRIADILKKSQAKNDIEQKDEDFQVRMQQIQVKVQPETKMANDNPKFDQMALKKRTEAGIQERRRLLNRQQEIIRTDSIKKLVSLLCDQVKMDENLRNLKIWFESTPQSDKYVRLFRVLQKLGFRLSQEQCARQFNLNQSENNPFFSVQGFEGNFERLAQAYKISIQHWEGKVSRKFDRRSLMEEGFSAQKIDLQRKGFIELQDLVRFLNIQSGTFFRNRDLFLIFKRLGGGDQVSFEGLMGQISAN